MPWPCLFNRVDWPIVLIVAAALFLTALLYACLWVASDADDYSEEWRKKDD